MARGIERRKLFLDNHDRAEFLRWVAPLTDAGALAVYAWAMMPRAQWGAGSASGWDPSGGSVSSGRARTAAGKILETGTGAVVIRLEKLHVP